MVDELVKKTVLGMVYTTLTRIVTTGLQALTQIILARRLVPSDYGVVGFAMIFVVFLQQFSDLGLMNAAVQRKNLSEEDLYTAFTVKLCLGLLAFSLCIAFSPLAGLLFDHPAISSVLRVLAIQFATSGLSFIPICLMTRAIDFRRISIANVGATIVRCIVAIALVLSGFRYWSIVIAETASALTTVLLVNLLNPVRIRLHFNREIASEFVRFGMNIFSSGLVVFLIFNIDNLVIGSVLGAVMLGYYALAFNWGSMITSILSDIVNRVLFPSFSRIQEARSMLKQGYLRVLEFVAFLAILVNLNLFLVSREFLFYILGRSSDKWLPALTVLRLLCFYGIFRALLEPVGNVVVALGKPRILLWANLIVAAIELTLIYPTARFIGIEGVAVLVAISYVTQYLVYFAFLRNECGIQLREIAASVGPSILAAVLVIPGGVIAGRLVQASFLSIFLKLAVVSAVYILIHTLLTKGKFIRKTISLVATLRSAE